MPLCPLGVWVMVSLPNHGSEKWSAVQIGAGCVITQELHLSPSLCVLIGIRAQSQVGKHVLRGMGLDVFWAVRWLNGENCLKLGITRVLVILFRLANCGLRKFERRARSCFIELVYFFTWEKKRNINNLCSLHWFSFVLQQTLSSQSVRILYKGTTVFLRCYI